MPLQNLVTIRKKEPVSSFQFRIQTDFVSPPQHPFIDHDWRDKLTLPDKTSNIMRGLMNNPEQYGLFQPAVRECYVDLEFKLRFSWNSNFVRLFHPHWLLEIRFQHDEFRKCHFLRWSQFSFLYFKESPEHNLVLQGNYLTPGGALQFDGYQIWTDDLLLIVEELWTNYHGGRFHDQYDFEMAFNSIVNTLRLHVFIQHQAHCCADCFTIHRRIKIGEQCEKCKLLFPDPV